MDLSSIIRKMGHSLVEIRVRALKSILCKLDLSLISVHDIVQEKMLFVYLLEWFNFPEVPMKEEALELLLTLSKHPSAAQMLRDVGAVDFLTQLSPNVEPSLRAVIDGTLDQLFHLPELLPSRVVVYSHGPRSTSSKGDSCFIPLYYIEHESVRCLKFSVFPWLTLTNTDRHILSSNENSLGSSNPNLVRTTCELLCDVIMQDFPAEIFLQRPGIVKSLLSLLRLGPGKEESGYIYLSALSCLRQLCVGLRRRLRFHQDPSFYSVKQDPVSQNSSFYTQEVLGTQRSGASSPGSECSPRPSLVGRTSQRARGDGQDGDAASNSGSSHRSGGAVQAPRQMAHSPAGVAHVELPDLGVEDVLELQLRQLTLAQFTVASMECAIPLLKTGLHAFHRVLELLCDAVLLLGDSVCELVWDDRSLAGMELKEKLQTCMELLGDILSYHHSCSVDIPNNSLVHHRIAYIGAAIFTIKLLQTILPPEKASNNLPENTATALFHLCLDTSLGSLLPSMQETAVAYLEQVNSDSHEIYKRVTRAALWMESTCIFLREAQAEGEKNWLELVELADQAIDGLPFHQHLPIIKECVHICSYLWKFEQPSPLLQTESQKLLLKLLAHPLLPVKTETYECTLNLVKDCLGIQNATRQEPGACTGVSFLLHHRVLYEISTFGLQDSVNALAKDILLFLLKGRLMMTASAWDRFNEALYPVMPILQGYASTEESLGNCVLLISDMSDMARDSVFPSTAKLKAALRLLFTKLPAVRIAAVQQFLPHLTGSDDSNTARPKLDQQMIASLPNLFCLKNPLDITLDTSKKSVLKVESVEKLFSILYSDMVDITLKRSAAEQLSVVLQGEISVKAIFIVRFDCLLEPCVCILRKLVYADPSLRHSLAQRQLLLLTLFVFNLSSRYNVPFQAASHHAVSPYCCVLVPSSDLQTLNPAYQALQVAWNTAWHSGIDNLLQEFHPDLKLSETQVLWLKAVHLPTALQDCIQAIVTASGHSSVASALSRLSIYLLIDRLAFPHIPTYRCRETLHSLSWQAAVTRFLQVRPACVEDERLLVGIIAFLNAYFTRIHTEFAADSEDKDLRWVLELLLNQDAVSLLNLLLGVETQTSTQSTGEHQEVKNHVSQRLQRELTHFFNTLLRCLSHTTDRLCLALAGPFESQLAVRLLQSLRVSDAPRFYGLPSLERTLQGMISMTAQPGWSSHCPDLEPSSLCLKYLSGLLEVISSFYVEWGGNSLSFMGKGVTKNAVICLLHLSHEMMSENKDKWSLGNEAAAEEASSSQLGLAWLIPLWVDRDQEVRFASLSLGAALSSMPSGCQALCASCQNISGGLWGTLLNILLDQQESSMVRREAAFILQNLLVMPMPANAEEAKDSHWQHPCVRDEVSGVSLVGLPALQALLYHCQYFQHVALSASSCYCGRYTFYIQPRVGSHCGPRLQESASSDCFPKFVCMLSLVTFFPPKPKQSFKIKSFLDIGPTLFAACPVVHSVCLFVAVLCHKICDSPFPFSDAGTRDVVCMCWVDMFMLLATLVKRDGSAAHPSVCAALGRHWRAFAAKLGRGGGIIVNLGLSCVLAGLIDTCVEQLKQTHTQLHLESVRPGKASHRKKVIKLTVEILRSALYCSDECKVVATDAHLTQALNALWPWLLLDDATMEAVLELLCVYTANCTTACSSLCGSGPGLVPGSKSSSTSSLMHSVMKLASALAPDNSIIQNLAFSLLANLVMSRDCRCLLQKNNFLQAFLSVPVPKAAGVKATSVSSGWSLLGLWLRLLASLSFTEDGQESILRLTGALELLADLAPHRRHALLTLQNLCFCPANKSHVIANDKAMKVLLSCLESKVMETRCMGASAIWALLHNNQRVQTHTHPSTKTFILVLLWLVFEFMVDPWQMKSSACLIVCL
uniref:Rotatin n=1 Tax=Neolamprologus brichardi TaxID=32507 RepID=A0A3Q4GE24_NEOBR